MHFKDIKFAIKNTNDALSKPLSYHIEFLQMALNDAELENYFKSIGIDYDTHKDQSHIINANQKEALEKVKKSWSYENVEKSFYNSANDILKTTENYV